MERHRRALEGTAREPGGWGRIGFYTSGQLFLEEYYTLGVIGKAGIGTPHMDGNTRLCTATAAAALKESFGSDGQPGTYADVDHCDAHRALRPQRGRDAGRAVDAHARPPARPRPARARGASTRATTPVAARGRRPPGAAPRHQPRAAQRAHPRGPRPRLGRRGLRRFAHCRLRGAPPTPSPTTRPSAWRGSATLRPRDVREAAADHRHQPSACSRRCCRASTSRTRRRRPRARSTTSTSCAACSGGPGAGVLQMNGQPTAQNTRETGADGDLPGFRNWDNREHIEELAELWNVDAGDDPALGAAHARDADLPLRRAGLHPPAVDRGDQPGRLAARSASHPPDPEPGGADGGRRRTSSSPRPPLLADVVLPAATWGEKLGTFTNADRTVHLSREGGRPAGRGPARPGHLARLRAPDGLPRPGRCAAVAWQRSGVGVRRVEGVLARAALRLQRAQLRPAARGQRHPVALHRGRAGRDGAALHGRPLQHRPRLLRDLRPGPRHRGHLTETEYRAREPAGRAFLHAAHYRPPPSSPAPEQPFLLTTGARLYHFHTRTKTGRAPELDAAAPEVWAELNAADADAARHGEGDLLRIASPRGALEARPGSAGSARGRLRPVPLRLLGPSRGGPATVAARRQRGDCHAWDPVSKQPAFKVTAVGIERIG